MKINYFQKGGTLLDLNREYIINTANASGNYGDLRKMIEGDGSLYNLNAKQRYISSGGTEAGFDRMNQLADEVYSNFIKNNPVENPFTTPVQKAAPTFNAVNDDIVNQVIKGKFGNGQARIDALTAAGYDPKEVLAAVNTRLRGSAIAPKQVTTPTLPVVEPSTLPAIETPAVAPVQQPTTPAWASPIVAPAPIRNQVSTNPTNPNKQMMVGSDYRQYRRDFAKKNGLVFAPNLFGELGNKKEQFTNPKTNRLVSEQELARLGWNPYYKEGGKINYFQQGGQIDIVTKIIKGLISDPEETLASLSQLAQQDKAQFNGIIQEIVKRAQDKKNPQIAQEATQAVEVLQQAMQGGLQTQAAPQQAPTAKNGAKLNYLKQLKGKCPEGEELVYMKKGGVVCPVCQKKKGGEVKNENKKQFFGKDKKVNKALMGVRLTLFPEATDSVTVREKIDSQGNGFRQETFPNDSVSVEMFGKRFPGFAGNYGNPKINISPKGKKVITEGANLPVSLPDTLHGADSTYINNKYKEILNNKAKLDTTYKVPIVPMDKKGGRAQFFKKEPKAPLAKCGKKVMAKCGCKAKKKK